MTDHSIKLEHTLTVVQGVEVGHAQDREALTGVTVVLCRAGGVGSLTIRGGAAGTRQLAALDPHHMVQRIHGFCLCGGSAYGLAAADGAMRALEQQGVGFDVGGPRVPILPSAVVFDLRLGNPDIRPDAQMGARAVGVASSDPVVQGCVGAGTGASIGKVLGITCATKGGLGSAGLRTPDGLEVGALAAVNAFGDVRDPETGRIVAGARNGDDSRHLVDVQRVIVDGLLPQRFAGGAPPPTQNTTLVVVATNARFDKVAMKLVARLAADAFPRVLSPASTQYDGDLVFGLATHTASEDLVTEPHQVGILARLAVEQAILNGVRSAEPLGGLPTARELE